MRLKSSTDPTFRCRTSLNSQQNISCLLCIRFNHMKLLISNLFFFFTKKVAILCVSTLLDPEVQQKIESIWCSGRVREVNLSNDGVDKCSIGGHVQAGVRAQGGRHWAQTCEVRGGCPKEDMLKLSSQWEVALIWLISSTSKGVYF